MSENKKKQDEALMKNLIHLKRHVLDVKFDLDTTAYQPIENIGIGAYGVVCSAIHRKTNDRVAIKKIPNVFYVKDVAKRTYREIKILKHFKHDNIIHIREILKPKESLADFRDVYVVFDLMESDLHKIIYSKQELTEEHVRYFLYQILRGLKYIHSAHVIHRDLKPSNLLVNEDCQLRIGDFGMARGFSNSPSQPKVLMTQYVATRWYRAPEIMLSLIEYGAAVDMWSVGCIFGEMLGRKHLFPGKEAISQIKLIVGIVGTPDNSLLELCQSPIIKNFFQEIGSKEPVPWSKMYPKASKKAINLLSRMLVLNPKNRITVEQALVHPYLNRYHDPDDEPICVPGFNFDFEQEDLTLPQLRETIHKEIMEYHEPRTPTLSFNACLRPVPKSFDTTPSESASQSGSMKTDNQPISAITDTKPESEVLTKPVTKLPSLTQDRPQSQSNEDEVFKKPLSAKNEDTSVYVKTENLLNTESTDIEMLSAKSTDGRQMMSATVTTDTSVSKENKEPMPRDETHKTISEDTKILIKAALMNASFKKRTDSQGDEDRPKPITAAMRQKEREDKRKKKKEKTLERKRKEKKKNASSEELLSNEDKELLQRWAKMQQVNVPIAPKPRSEVAGQGRSSTSGSSQSTSQSIGDTAGGKIKKVGSDGSAEGQGQIFHSTERNVQQGTLDLLQQRILNNTTIASQTNAHIVNTSQTQAQLPNIVTATDHTSQANISSQNSMQVQNTQNAITSHNTLPVHPGDNFSVDFSGVTMDDLSNVPLGDLDFLAMSPDIENILGGGSLPGHHVSPPVSTQQNYNPVSISQIYNGSQYNPQTYNTQTNTTAFIENMCSNPQQINSQRTSGNFVPLELPRDNSRLSVSPNFPNNSVSPTGASFLSVHSPESIHSTSPCNQHISPNVPFDRGSDQPLQQHGYIPPILSSYQNEDLSLSSINPSNLFLQSRQPSEQTVSQPFPQSTDQTQTFYRNQSGILDVNDSHNSSSNSNSPPALSVNTQQAQMTFRQMFQEPVAGPSNMGQLDATQVDLIGLLSKQLSKSNVGDVCPPLALTPRGTGGGYGVGVDLDSIMTAPDPDSQGSEPSPLSSSILADWIEVTGNMNIDMEALEQELQSPMSLSYNDLNLYSS
ncbi:Mitogen-activated protein kinase 7 [Mactra antiquata]